MEPKVLYYHFRSATIACGQRTIIVDVVNRDKKNLEMINLSRVDAMTILMNATPDKKKRAEVKKVFKELKDREDKMEVPGRIGRMSGKTCLYYAERSADGTVDTLKIPFPASSLICLSYTCFACGAYAPFTCPAKICGFRYCSRQCYILNPMCHTISCKRYILICFMFG